MRWSSYTTRPDLTTPTPPLPSPATKVAGAALRVPRGSAHLANPTWRELGRVVWELDETSKATTAATTDNAAIPLAHRRCLRWRASGKRTWISNCDGAIFGLLVVVVIVPSSRGRCQNYYWPLLVPRAKSTTTSRSRSAGLFKWLERPRVPHEGVSTRRTIGSSRRHVLPPTDAYPRWFVRPPPSRRTARQAPFRAPLSPRRCPTWSG
jgi:hypothetical protein